MKKLTYTTALIILPGILSISTISYAAQQNILATPRISVKKLPQNEIYDQALVDVAEALLQDPQNKNLFSAIDELLSQNTLPSDYKILLYQFRDLLTFNEVLRSEIKTLKKNNILFKSRLIQSGMKEDLLYKLTQKEIKKYPDLKYKQQISDLPGDVFLIEVNNMLELEKQHLLTIKEQITNEYNDLIAIKNDYFLNNRFEEHFRGKEYAKRFYSEEGALMLKPNTIAIVKSHDREVQEANMLDELRKEIKQAQIKYDMLYAMVNSKDERIEKMQSDIVDLTMQVTQNDQLITQKDRSLDQMNQEIEEVNSRFELSQEIIKNKADEISRLQDKLIEIQDVKDQKQNLEGKLKDAQLQMDELRAEKDSIKKESRDLRKRISELEFDVLLAQKQIALKEERVQSLQEKSLVSVSVTSEKAEVEELKNRNVELTKQLQRLKSKMYSLQMSQMKNKNSVEEKVIEGRVTEMNVQIKKLENQLSQKNKQVTDLLSKIESLPKQSEVSFLDQQLEKVKKEFSVLKKENVELASRDKKLNVLKNKNKEIEKINDVLRKDLQNAEKRIADKNDEIARLNQLISKNQNTVDVGKNDQYVKYIYQLEGVLSLYKEELSDTKNALKSNKASISTLEEQLTLVQTQLYQKDEILQKTQAMLEDTQEQMDLLKKELDVLRLQENQASMSEVERLQAEHKYRNMFFQTKRLNTILSTFIHEILSFKQNFKVSLP